MRFAHESVLPELLPASSPGTRRVPLQNGNSTGSNRDLLLRLLNKLSVPEDKRMNVAVMGFVARCDLCDSRSYYKCSPGPHVQNDLICKIETTCVVIKYEKNDTCYCTFSERHRNRPDNILWIKFGHFQNTRVSLKKKFTFCLPKMLRLDVKYQTTARIG